MQQIRTKNMQKPAGKPLMPVISTQDMEKVISVRNERQQTLSRMKPPPCRR